MAHLRNILFFSHVVLLLANFSLEDLDFRLACDIPARAIHGYDWNTLRNRTSFEHLPFLDKNTAIGLLTSSPASSPDHIFSPKELASQCLIGSLVIEILSLWAGAPETEYVALVSQGFPWEYLRFLDRVAQTQLARVLWSHWNLFGVLRRFLERLPLHGLPLPRLRKRADRIFVTALLRAHADVDAHNTYTHTRMPTSTFNSSSNSSSVWSDGINIRVINPHIYSRELFPENLIQEVMQSEDAEVRAAAMLVHVHHIVARSFARGPESRYEDVGVWEAHRWSNLNDARNRFLEDATDLLSNSLPSRHTLQECLNDIVSPTSSDSVRFTNENLRACWPRNAWGGRLVFPLLEHMGHEWVSYAMRGQEPHRWSSAVMRSSHMKYFSNQADFIHESNMVQESVGQFLYLLGVSPVVKHDRLLLSTTGVCWEDGVFTPELCCKTGGVGCFEGVFTQGRCCDDEADDTTRADNDEYRFAKKESAATNGTWAVVLCAHDEASAQLYSEAVSLVAYQVRGIELSRRQAHRPFVAITDAQTMRVLTEYPDTKARLEENGVTLRLASKTVLDLDDPRFPPSGNKTYYGKYEKWSFFWHKLYLWDPSMWNNEVPVVFLDADILPVHEGVLEAFSLPKSTTLAVGHFYGDGVKSFTSKPTFNTGIMVVHPDPLVFEFVAQKAYAGWGFPSSCSNDEQSWLNDLFHQFSVRYYMKVPGPAWDTWFDGAAAYDNKSPPTTETFSRWNPKTLDLLPPHIVLPHAYNFFVDSAHAPFLSDVGARSGADLIDNSAWSPGLGYRTDRPVPRLLHTPGKNAKPWGRCSKATRSLVDAWWWKAHGLMCSKSKKPCFLECDQ